MTRTLNLTKIIGNCFDRGKAESMRSARGAFQFEKGVNFFPRPCTDVKCLLRLRLRVKCYGSVGNYYVGFESCTASYLESLVCKRSGAPCVRVTTALIAVPSSVG